MEVYANIVIIEANLEYTGFVCRLFKNRYESCMSGQHYSCEIRACGKSCHFVTVVVNQVEGRVNLLVNTEQQEELPGQRPI